RHRQDLAGLPLPDHVPAAGVVLGPAGVALPVLDHVAAADRARAQVGPLDLHVLSLSSSWTVSVVNFATSDMNAPRLSCPCSIRPRRRSQSPVSSGEVSGCEPSSRITWIPLSVATSARPSRSM